MHIEYKIKYKIDGDIPINPDWIRGQLHASVQALQKEILKVFRDDNWLPVEHAN